MPARFRIPNPSIATGLLCLALASLVVPAGADETGAVDRALERLANLDRDPMLLPAPPAPPEEIDVRAHLAIARSIQTVEAQLDTSLAVLTGEVLPLLSLARNYRHLGLRGRALTWYDRAALADKNDVFTDEILAERFEIGLELGDSLLVTEGARAMLDRSDAILWTNRLGDALGFLALSASTDDAAKLARRIETLRGEVDADCAIELARLHQRRDEDRQARDLYRELVRRESRISPRQMSLALMGLADAELARGDTSKAAALLQKYREHDLGRLSAWATYQLAGLAAAAARYDEAEHLFRSLCERETATPWQENACTRWAQMRELHDIDDELRPYGRSLRPAEGKR